MTLTLTPDAHAYAVAAAVTYSLSCAWLAGAAVARVRRPRSAGFMPVYVALLAAVAGLSVWALDPEHVTRTSVGELVLGLPVGVAAGAAAVVAEIVVVRAARRRSRAGERVRHAPAQRSAMAAQGLTSGGDPRPLARPGDRARQALPLLLAVAALEEILFRGVLLDLALSVPGAGFAAAAVVGLALAFALTHIAFGWTEVLAKLPLSALATLAALVTGSVAAAVAAHALINFRAWRA